MNIRAHEASPIFRAVACALIVACLLPFPVALRAQAAEAPDRSGSGSTPLDLAARVAERPGQACRVTTTWLDDKAMSWSARDSGSSIRRSVDRLDGHALALTATTMAASASSGQYGRRWGRRGNRGAIGLALGALGGFVAGGLIGEELTTAHSCNCSDPKLHGFLVGGAIGAVVGGFLGYAIAR